MLNECPVSFFDFMAGCWLVLKVCLETTDKRRKNLNWWGLYLLAWLRQGSNDFTTHSIMNVVNRQTCEPDLIFPISESLTVFMSRCKVIQISPINDIMDWPFHTKLPKLTSTLTSSSGKFVDRGEAIMPRGLFDLKIEIIPGICREPFRLMFSKKRLSFVEHSVFFNNLCVKGNHFWSVKFNWFSLSSNTR